VSSFLTAHQHIIGYSVPYASISQANWVNPALQMSGVAALIGWDEGGNVTSLLLGGR